MIDEAFLSLGDFFVELTDQEGRVEGGDYGFDMEIESLKLGLPVQLDIIVNEDDSVQVGAAPPLYYVETSVTPVFHSIKISLDKEA